MSRRRRSPRPHKVRTKHPRFNVSQYMRGKGVVFESQYKKYSHLVRIDKLEEAKITADRLLDEFKSAKQNAKKLRIIRITMLARDKALHASNNPSLTPNERKEAKDIAFTYDRLVKQLSRLYGQDS